MISTFLNSYIQRAAVTRTGLYFHGRISVDTSLFAETCIFNNRKVFSANINNDPGFETYPIPGPPGSGVTYLKPAAAGLGKIVDKVITISYPAMLTREYLEYSSQVIHLDDRHYIKKSVSKNV